MSRNTSNALIFSVAALVLVTGAVVLATGIDRAREDTWYDGSLYIGALALVYATCDALRRALNLKRGDTR